MNPGKLNLTVIQGADFTMPLKFTAPPIPPATSGLPINLTGSTFRGKIKKNISDTISIVSFTFAIADQTTNEGEVTVSLTAAQTAAIVLKPQRGQERVFENFVYDIEQIYPSGKIDRILEGVVAISPEVTT